MKILWYYTSVKILRKSMLDKMIKVPEKINEKKAPCLWLSLNPEWDQFPPELESGNWDHKDHDKDANQCARIGVEMSREFNDWDTFKNLNVLSKKDIREIELWAAYDMPMFTPLDWFFTLKNIPLDKWERVEYLVDGRWVEFPHRSDPKYPFEWR